MGDNTEPGRAYATDCADVFNEFFSTIAAHPDYTLNWPSYQGYIIETYTSWIGRHGDKYGLIFDKHLFHKYKMKNLVPTILEQLRQPEWTITLAVTEIMHESGPHRYLVHPLLDVEGSICSFFHCPFMPPKPPLPLGASFVVKPIPSENIKERHVDLSQMSKGSGLINHMGAVLSACLQH